MMNFERPADPSAEQEAWRDIAEEKREHLDRITRLSIGAIPKAEAILVLLHQKPATEIDLFEQNDPAESVEEVFRNAGLVVFRQPKTNGARAWTDMRIARDQETLNQLKNADAHSDHEAYGRLMGYPETAIQAFIGNAEKAEGRARDDKGIIFGMRYSKEHQQEEEALLKHWSEIIQEVAPTVYREARGEEEE